MKTTKTIIVLLLGVLIQSCGTTTMITSSWRKNHATANGYQNIFVAAITSNVSAKQAVENGLQQQLQEKGLSVEKSIDVFPPDFSNQTGQKKELILSKIRGTNADGILTIALLRQETESHYHPGTYWDPGLRFGY